MSKSDTWRQTVHMHIYDFIGTGKPTYDKGMLDWRIVGERSDPRVLIAWRKWVQPVFSTTIPGTLVYGGWTSVANFDFSLKEIRDAANKCRLRAYIEEEIVTQRIIGGW